MDQALTQEMNRYQYARAEWEAVESYMDQNGYLVCNANHLSTWTVGELAETSEPSVDMSQGGIPAEYLYMGAVGIVVLLVIAGVFTYKKRK